MATRMKPRRQSGSLKAALARALAGLPAGIARAVLATADESIDLRQAVPVDGQRVAVPGLDHLGGGVVERLRRTARDRRRPAAVIVSRKSTACSIPIEAPLPDRSD